MSRLESANSTALAAIVAYEGLARTGFYRIELIVCPLNKIDIRLW
jgi:hypothetical protein